MTGGGALGITLLLPEVRYPATFGAVTKHTRNVMTIDGRQN